MFWFFKKVRDNTSEKLDSMNFMVKNSFENIKKDMSLISQWINYFNKKHDGNDQKMTSIFARLEILEHKLSKENSYFQERQPRSIVHERVQSFKRSNQSFMNVQSLKKIGKRLTPAEKKLIQLLHLAKRPLDYDEIAKELKVSVITARRHMNDIKKVGFKLEERKDLDTGRKVFFIEEKVKKAISG